MPDFTETHSQASTAGSLALTAYSPFMPAVVTCSEDSPATPTEAPEAGQVELFGTHAREAIAVAKNLLKK